MSSRPLRSPFRPAVAEWFAETFDAPTRAQKLGWPAIARGESTLVLAPTGSGKTLAAFLAAIDRLMFAPVPPKGERCRILYVSPLKALAVDVERNLRAPIEGISRVAERRGESVHLPQVAIRSGDTPAAERARMRRRPPTHPAHRASVTMSPIVPERSGWSLSLARFLSTKLTKFDISRTLVPRSVCPHPIAGISGMKSCCRMWRVRTSRGEAFGQQSETDRFGCLDGPTLYERGAVASRGVWRMS